MLDYKIITLFAAFVIFSFVALIVAIKPVIKNPMKAILSAVVLLTVVGFLYAFWGGFGDYSNYRALDESKKQSLQLLSEIKSPEELVEKLRKHLKRNPNNARGWYLLGRVYISQGQTQNALDAFAKAYTIDPNDTAIIVNYAQSLLEANDLKGEELLKDLLVKDPNQPDALAILAMHAYSQDKFQVAIDYWQKLLESIPEQSPEATEVRKAIAAAHAKLKDL